MDAIVLTNARNSIFPGYDPRRPPVPLPRQQVYIREYGKALLEPLAEVLDDPSRIRPPRWVPLESSFSSGKWVVKPRPTSW